MHARADPVRGPLLDATPGLAYRAHRHRADRLSLRRGQHARDDAYVQESMGDSWEIRPLRALRALGWRAIDARAEGRQVALQQGAPLYRSLPRDQGDLVVRLGLRWQRSARQEVFLPADRLDHGARAGLARRAHAHSRSDPGL